MDSLMKNNKPFGLFDEHFRLEKISKQGDPLEKLKKIIKWEIFRKTIENIFIKENKGPGGRPRYDIILMFKVLILQRYYNISDEQIEYQILDRLSFMRFLNLNIKDDVPDHNTIWNFREDLTKANIIEKLFEQFNKELEKNNLIAHKGSIIDASFVEVPRQRNNKDENDKIIKNEIPEDWKENPNKLNHKDINARWITKEKQRYYGYKNHIKVDAKSKIIKKFVTTDASVHDSQIIEKLLDRKDKNKELYADSAYSGKPIRKKLFKKDIINKIHEKGYRGKPITENQKIRNKEKSKIRARIEHVFGFIENSMNGSFLRVIGIKRINTQIGLINLTYNMFRYMQLAKI
jgi:IS5 family transposase